MKVFGLTVDLYAVLNYIYYRNTRVKKKKIHFKTTIKFTCVCLCPRIDVSSTI